MAASKKKYDNKNITVIDTSVLLDDSDCLNNIPNQRIIIPYTVLEELDKKKTDIELGFSARKTLRLLDQLNGSIHSGAFLENGSSIEVVDINSNSKNNDQKIIDTALLFNEDNKVTLLSQDVCMRVKSRALNINAEAYGRDAIKEKQVEEVKDKIYSGVGDIELTKQQMADFYKDGQLCITEIFKNRYDNENEIFPNEFLKIEGAYKEDKTEGIGIVKLENDIWFLRKIKDYRHSNKRAIKPKNLEQNLLMNLFWDDTIVCTSVMGKAGTGKSLLALESALNQHLHRGIKTIYLTKPQRSVDKSEDQGFYPGDPNEKFAPWLGNFFCNLEQIMDDDDIDDFIRNNIIKMLPIGLCRGLSISSSIVIADEVQNWNNKVMKTLMTRIGQNSKIFCLSDIEQIDNPYLSLLDNGGISCAKQEFKRSPLMANITLKQNERSPFSMLVASVL